MSEKQAYTLEWMDYRILLDKIQEETAKQLGFPLTFMFELASDGNTDLYLMTKTFSEEQVRKMAEQGWFQEGVLCDMVETENFLEDFVPDDYLDMMPHELFVFALGKTFKEGTHVAGIEPGCDDEPVLLNIAVPV